MFNVIDKYKNDYVIIYCKTRAKAEKINKKLIENNYRSGVYHAGLE